MSCAIFTRFNLVVNPGWLQIRDMLLVAVACWGVTYSIFGKFSNNRASNIIVRAALTLASFACLPCAMLGSGSKPHEQV